MIEKESVEAFLTILASLNDDDFFKIYGTSLRNMLYSINLEEAMTTYVNYISKFHAGDRVIVVPTQQKGVILSLSDDNKQAFVVMDEYNNFSEQVICILTADLQKEG